MEDRGSVQEQQTHDEQEVDFNEPAGTSSNDRALETVAFVEINNELESSDNRVAATFPNLTGNQSSAWSSSDVWSTSTERDERQDQFVEYRQNGTNQVRIPNDNGAKFVNTFTNNSKLKLNFNETRIYNGPVTVHCCPSTFFDCLKSRSSKRCIAGATATLALLLIIIQLGIWFSNTSIITQRPRVPLIITTTTTDAGDLLYSGQDLVATVLSDTDINIYKAPVRNESTTMSSANYSTNIEDIMELNGKGKEQIKTITENNALKMITRDEWDAAPSNRPLVKLAVLPAPRVIISETSTESCDKLDKCIKLIRNIQRSHLRLYTDIAYNFLVADDGFIYEGRGWDMQASVAYHFDRESISIAFIGNFSSIMPSEKQVRAAMKLIQVGVENGNISSLFSLKGKKQLSIFSDNPGDKLYNIVTKWRQWEPGTIGIDFAMPTGEFNETMATINMFTNTKFRYIPKRGRN